MPSQAQRMFSLRIDQTDRSVLLYPPPDGNAKPSRPNPNFYQPFKAVDSGFEQRVKEVVEKENERLSAGDGKVLDQPPALVSALTKALCCEC